LETDKCVKPTKTDIVNVRAHRTATHRESKREGQTEKEKERDRWIQTQQEKEKERDRCIQTQQEKE